MTGPTDPEFAPPGVDLEHPNAARVYDYLLGGTANWAIDRELGDGIVRAAPQARTVAMTNREFLGRAVRYCARQGIRQFLDIGSGVPTVGNVHQVADEIDTTSRCVYVDYEPVAVAHSQVLLDAHGDPERHAIVNADLRDTETVWQRALDTGVLDPAQPVGLLMVAVLPYILPFEAANAAVARYRELLPSGSHLVISHYCAEGVSPRVGAEIEQVVAHFERTSTPMYPRPRAECAAFFGDFDLAEPGLTWLAEWRMDEHDSPASRLLAGDPSACVYVGGVGRKP